MKSEPQFQRDWGAAWEELMPSAPRSWADMPLEWRDEVWRHYYRVIARETCPFCFAHMELDKISPTGQVFALCPLCQRQDLYDEIPLDTRRGAPKRL